jgi:hypothetical protein
MLLLLSIAHAEDLYVSSNERDAAILLNGVDTGFRTPATVHGVKPGETVVTVEGGCSRGEAVVTVLPDLVTRASIVATEQLGTLTLLPTPVQASLEVDGAPFQGAPGMPIAVSCGDHDVRATLDGYVPAILTIGVEMGQDLAVPINLAKLGLGALDLSVQPRSATLFVDGKPVGNDAVTLPSVYQGVHTLSAELDGYRSVKKQIVVEDGAALAYHFTLVRTSQKKAESTITQLGGATETAGATHGGAVAADDDAGTGADRAPDRPADRQSERDAAREAERQAAAQRDADARAAAQQAADREAERQAAAKHDADLRAAAKRDAEAEREAAAKRDADERAAADARASREAEEQAARDAEAQAARDAEAQAARDAEEADRQAARKAARQDAEREAARRTAEREAAEREAAEREAADADVADDDGDVADREARTSGASRARATSTAEVDRPRKPIGKTLGGIGLLTAGVGAGVYTIVALDATEHAYSAYNAKVDAARGDQRAEHAADTFYDDNVVPKRNLFWGSAIGSGLFLAGGIVVLVVDDHLPAFVPAPGGGMLLWSGRF